MYALVKLTRQSASGHPWPVLCGVCGNRRLLEKIRAGQSHPEEWRVSDVRLSGLYKSMVFRRKAG